VNPPLGKTTFGVTVWPVPPRQPGQETGLRHLTWQGPGDEVHLCAGGVRKDDQEFHGQVQTSVSGTCADLAEAQHSVDAYISSLGATAPINERRDT